MITLAIDTATKTAGVALLRDETVLVEYFFNLSVNHSETVLPAAHQGLAGGAWKPHPGGRAEGRVSADPATGASGRARDETYMELSGTSMSASGAAGAAALLLEARPLARAAAKVLLQFTSSRVAGTGLLEAGAGSLNAVQAVGMATGRADMTDSGLIA